MYRDNWNSIFCIPELEMEYTLLHLSPFQAGKQTTYSIKWQASITVTSINNNLQDTDPSQQVV